MPLNVRFLLVSLNTNGDLLILISIAHPNGMCGCGVLAIHCAINTSKVHTDAKRDKIDDEST